MHAACMCETAPEEAIAAVKWLVGEHKREADVHVQDQVTQIKS